MLDFVQEKVAQLKYNLCMATSDFHSWLSWL